MSILSNCGLDSKTNAIKWIRENYYVGEDLKYKPKEDEDFIFLGSGYGIQDNIVIFMNDIYLKENAYSFTNGDFIIAMCEGTFSCCNNSNIETLEGGPRCIYQDLVCECCKNLVSLKGAPMQLGRPNSGYYGTIYCGDCKNLKDISNVPTTHISLDITNCDLLIDKWKTQLPHNFFELYNLLEGTFENHPEVDLFDETLPFLPHNDEFEEACSGKWGDGYYDIF